MAEIDVRPVEPGETSRFQVTVREGPSETSHRVTVRESDLLRLGGAHGSAEDLVRASFEFLLAREPKEQILGEFDLSVISRYFPEYEDEIARPG